MGFQEILLMGQAPDRGLFMPSIIPSISLEEQLKFASFSYAEIAYEILLKFLKEDIPKDELSKLTNDAYNFEVPIFSIKDNIHILKLDKGPTAAFKDFAARMMSRLMQFYIKKKQANLVILVATSGDTGGSIADAFFKLENIEVVILYPKKEISDRQRKQMTTLGNNVAALGLKGKFDDCQAFVKEAFADPELNEIPLTSANSINFGRILPQIIYYFYAASRVAPGKEIIFSVPSGNFGNLMGGVFAKHMGLPVKRFVVAVNENDEFPQFLKTGLYNKVEPSRACLSNAMNVGHPSNLARLVDLYGGHLNENGLLQKTPDMEKMRTDFWSISVSDQSTKETINKVHIENDFIIEAHGAVGWCGLELFLKINPTNIPCIVFETADPAKFPAEIKEVIGIEVEMTEKMKQQAQKDEILQDLEKDYNKFKEYLLKRFQKQKLNKN